MHIPLWVGPAGPVWCCLWPASENGAQWRPCGGPQKLEHHLPSCLLAGQHCQALRWRCWGCWQQQLHCCCPLSHMSPSASPWSSLSHHFWGGGHLPWQLHCHSGTLVLRWRTQRWGTGCSPWKASCLLLHRDPLRCLRCCWCDGVPSEESGEGEGNGQIPDFQCHLHLFLHYGWHPLCRQSGHYRTSSKLIARLKNCLKFLFIYLYSLADFVVVPSTGCCENIW